MIDRYDLLRRTDLAALLDELSPAPATRLGSSARWRCIDAGHDDQHPSITMFVDRRGVQRWKCWSGGHGGTAIDALLVARGGSITEALAELEHRAGRAPDVTRSRPLPSWTPAAVETRTELDAALLDYVAACERILWQPAGRKVLDYLVNERGLAPDALKANHVGADPGPSVLRRAAGLPRGGTAAVLPALDLQGKVAYVQARYLEPVEGRPKYDNPASRLAANPRIGWVRPATLSTMTCPGHRRDRDPMLRAGDTWRVGLDEHLDRSGIERPPPPPTLHAVIARTTLQATAAPPAGALAEPAPDHDLTRLFVELDVLDHRPMFDAAHPRPAPLGLHPVAPLR
jgi:hypothetical protein